MEKFKIINHKVKCYCPICGKYFESSDFLNKELKNENSRWFANMVTHYRHNHIDWWNNCWGRNGGDYRNGWFCDYDEEKHKVNESSKRQIIRKCKEYILGIDFQKSDLMALQGNEVETINLFDKIIINNLKK